MFKSNSNFIFFTIIQFILIMLVGTNVCNLCGVWEETRLPVANPPSRLGDFMNISQLGCRVSNPGCSSERRAVYLTYNICAPHSSPSLLVGQTGEVHITIGETCTGQDMGRADNDQTYRCRTATGIQR